MSEATKEAVFDFSKFSALDPTIDYYTYDCQLQKAGENTVKSVLRAQVRKHATVVFRLGRNKITGISSVSAQKHKKTIVKFLTSVGAKWHTPTAGQLVITDGHPEIVQ